jgi:ectoine hydroxylase-related dioxygenase (phytanoyl-CoA dioxygenase family)
MMTGERSNSDPSSDLVTNGYAIISHVLSDLELGELITWSRKFEGHKLARRGTTFAIRYLLNNQVIQDLARKPAIRDLAATFVGPKCFAIGGTLFDKVADANWLVPFHQDVTAAVKARRDATGFGPWSVKGGFPNVQLPSEILENLVTIRVHLDNCSSDDGPLRVLPGSHLGGRLDAGQILKAKSSIPERVCIVRKGDALVMRPLLLHASSASRSGRPRRVLQIEFAGSDLPHRLEWRFAVH